MKLFKRTRNPDQLDADDVLVEFGPDDVIDVRTLPGSDVVAQLGPDVIDLDRARAELLTECPYCGGELEERLGAKVCTRRGALPGCGTRFGDLDVIPELGPFGDFEVDA